MGYKFNPFTGNLDEVSAGGGGGGTPGGSDTQVQYNNAGSFGGSADLTWNDTAKELGVGGDINLDDGGTYSTTVQAVTPTANRTISFPDATGTVALVAGSNQAVQYNSAGANAGDSGLLYDATSGSLTVGGKTVTTSAPVINLSQTWNNAATTFTGLKLNVTNTASAAASNLLDLQVNGTTTMRVSGLNIAAKLTTGTGSELELGNNCGITNVASGRNVYLRPGPLGGAHVVGNTPFGWGSSTNTTATSMSLQLWNPAEHTLEQRNGTNAQTFRLYNTYTDASNYERTSITRDSSGLVIDAQKGGTGADPTNLLDLKLGGTSKIKFDKFGINYGVASAITNYIGVGAAFGAVNGFRIYGDTGTLRFASNHTVGWTANATESFTTLDTALARDSAGVVKITNGSTGTGYIKQVPVAVSALPAAATVGAGTRGFVNDANATTFASVVAGGGANVVPVYSDGTDWRIG